MIKEKASIAPIVTFHHISGSSKLLSSHLCPNENADLAHRNTKPAKMKLKHYLSLSLNFHILSFLHYLCPVHEVHALRQGVDIGTSFQIILIHYVSFT